MTSIQDYSTIPFTKAYTHKRYTCKLHFNHDNQSQPLEYWVEYINNPTKQLLEQHIIILFPNLKIPKYITKSEGNVRQ